MYTPRCGASSAQGVVGGTFKRDLSLVSEQGPAENEREKYVVGKSTARGSGNVCIAEL